MSAKEKKQSAPRFKRTVYTDIDPGLEEGIKRAMADSRIFTTFACAGIRDWLLKNGYGDKQWKGKKFSEEKFV